MKDDTGSSDTFPGFRGKNSDQLFSYLCPRVRTVDEPAPQGEELIGGNNSGM